MNKEEWNKIQVNLNRSGQGEQLAWTDNDDVRGHARIVDPDQTEKVSDDQVLEAASRALFNNQEMDASGIEVSVNDGVVSLSGIVEDQQMKRAAEASVESVGGVTEVRNELQVTERLS